MTDQEDNCSICFNIFTEPKKIHCGHTFCRTCLEDYVTKCSKSKTFPCPLCRHNVEVPQGGIKMFPSTNSKKRKIDQESAASVSGIQSLPSTSFSTEGETIDAVAVKTEGETIDAVAVKTEGETIDAVTVKTDKIYSCDACKSSDNDIYKCIECNKYMCCSCKNARHDAFCTDHHVFIVFNQDKQTSGSIRQCIQHPKEKLEFYCKDCSVAICNTCRTPAHQDHDVLGICDYRDDVEAEFKMLKDELEIKSSEFENYVGEVNAKIDSMNESARTSCSKIDQHVQRICDIVIQRGAKLKENLNKTFNEDEQKMKKIVDGTKDLIGRLAKIAQNISDILIGDCMYDMTEMLPIMKRQRSEWESRDLANVHGVISKHHTEPIDIKSVNNMVGEFRVERQTKTTLEHSFNYDVMKYNQRDEWVSSPPVRLQDCSLNIRAKIKTDYSADLGLYVNLEDGLNKSAIKYCTVNATMTFSYPERSNDTMTFSYPYRSNFNEVKPETKTFTEKFTPPIGKLTWANVDRVINFSQYKRTCTASATVDITMTTVI